MACVTRCCRAQFLQKWGSAQTEVGSISKAKCERALERRECVTRTAAFGPEWPEGEQDKRYEVLPEQRADQPLSGIPCHSMS